MSHSSLVSNTSPPTYAPHIVLVLVIVWRRKGEEMWLRFRWLNGTASATALELVRVEP